MRTRVYSICRRCARVFPAERKCPACDGDVVAAREIAEARAHAIEQLAQPPRRRSSPAVALAALTALVIALGAAVAAIASTEPEPSPPTASGASGAGPVSGASASGAGGAAQVHE